MRTDPPLRISRDAERETGYGRACRGIWWTGEDRAEGYALQGRAYVRHEGATEWGARLASGLPRLRLHRVGVELKPGRHVVPATDDVDLRGLERAIVRSLAAPSVPPSANPSMRTHFEWRRRPMGRWTGAPAGIAAWLDANVRWLTGVVVLRLTFPDLELSALDRLALRREEAREPRAGVSP